MRRATALVVALAAVVVHSASGRTCLSTRRTARISCSVKCRADLAERHCRVCICAACAFCGTAVATSASESDAASSSAVAPDGKARKRSPPRGTGRSVSRAGEGRVRRGSVPSSSSSSTGSSSSTSRRISRRRGHASSRSPVREPVSGASGGEHSGMQPARSEKRNKRRRPNLRARATLDEPDRASQSAVVRARLGISRRWEATAAIRSREALRNRTLPSVVLRILGYLPGPQLPLEFGGPISDYSVGGASSSKVAALLRAETAAAGPVPRSVREQRELARRGGANRGASNGKEVDWHASPVAGLLPGRQARPPTPKARAQKRKRRQPLGGLELSGALVGAQNLTLHWPRSHAIHGRPKKSRRHKHGSTSNEMVKSGHGSDATLKRNHSMEIARGRRKKEQRIRRPRKRSPDDAAHAHDRLPSATKPSARHRRPHSLSRNATRIEKRAQRPKRHPRVAATGARNATGAPRHRPRKQGKGQHQRQPDRARQKDDGERQTDGADAEHGTDSKVRKKSGARDGRHAKLGKKLSGHKKRSASKQIAKSSSVRPTSRQGVAKHAAAESKQTEGMDSTVGEGKTARARRRSESSRRRDSTLAAKGAKRARLRGSNAKPRRNNNAQRIEEGTDE